MTKNTLNLYATPILKSGNLLRPPPPPFVGLDVRKRGRGGHSDAYSVQQGGRGGV